MLFPTIPAPMITTRWTAGSCWVESAPVVAISVIYQKYATGVNALGRSVRAAARAPAHPPLAEPSRANCRHFFPRGETKWRQLALRARQNCTEPAARSRGGAAGGAARRAR